MKNEKCWYKEVCEQECGSTCIRFLEMDHLVQVSGIPAGRQYPISLQPDTVDYEAFCKLATIKDNIQDFVKNGQNLFITSNSTGNGKTSWAIKLMLKYFDEVWAGNGFKIRGLFLHTPSILDQLKNFKDPVSPEFKQHILEADLVIWDDIASTELSNYDLSQLLIYIDARIMNGKSNIYTGNIVSQAQLEKSMGIRLASRIYNNSHAIIFLGKDRRTSI